MTSSSDILGGLLEDEIFWRDRYDWLKEHGYTLRPGYKPDWVPPWKNTGEPPSMYEEGMSLTVLISYLPSTCPRNNIELGRPGSRRGARLGWEHSRPQASIAVNTPG